MILAVVLFFVAGVSGWLLGLTLHTWRTAPWRDPGARAAWLAACGAVGGTCLLAAVVTAVLTGGVARLASVPVGLLVFVVVGWAASERMSLDFRRTDGLGPRSVELGP